MKKKTLIRLGAAILGAAILTAIAWSGVLYQPDITVSDALYQHPGMTDGEIVVIGMDERATDALGPMPWPRYIMAEVLEYLNSVPEEKPAIIGIDVLFVGASGDPSADDYLTEVAEDGGNIVLASAATFGSKVIDNGESFYLDNRAVLYWDSPFPELAAVTDTGHINAMSDNDGIMRHSLLYVDVPDQGRVYSFARVVYERYCQVHGLTPNPLPETIDIGFFYLPFTAKGGGYYESISVIDILDGIIEPDYFAGKIVLIGPYASGMQDAYPTSIQHSFPMYGIEIMANQIDAFRNGFYPKEVGNTVQLILLFLICAAVLYFLWDRQVLPAVIIWLAVSGLWIGLCMVLYRMGFVLHVLWVPLFVTVLFVFTVVLNYIRTQKEKRKVTDTFGRYVDPAVMKELLEKGGDALELGGKIYDIAVLFVDIRGFTTMSESLEPQTVVEIINRYLTLTTECIMRHHGMLDKFVGDCTMAFWNAPVPQEDPVYLACCAAMDMVEGSKTLGVELQERFGRTVAFGVGVNVGPAVVGNIGAPKRMDYTAIGDTVNTASRLESNAPGGKIYISRAVADALGDRAKVTSLGSTIKLKGKAEGFEVLTLDELDY